LPPALQQAGQDQRNYGVFGFPNGTGRQYEGSGQLQIAAKSKNPALAAKFIDFATSVAEQSKYYGTLNGPISVTIGAKPRGPKAVASRTTV
jgi:raffinose/stachyose/melibiose transport system substrate-binding protein